MSFSMSVAGTVNVTGCPATISISSMVPRNGGESAHASVSATTVTWNVC